MRHQHSSIIINRQSPPVFAVTSLVLLTFSCANCDLGHLPAALLDASQRLVASQTRPTGHDSLQSSESLLCPVRTLAMMTAVFGRLQARSLELSYESDRRSWIGEGKESRGGDGGQGVGGD